MNGVDVMCWLENGLSWCLMGSGWLLGGEEGGSSWQLQFGLEKKEKKSHPPNYIPVKLLSLH